MAAGLIGFSAVAWVSLHPSATPCGHRFREGECARRRHHGAARRHAAEARRSWSCTRSPKARCRPAPARIRRSARSELFGAMVRQTILLPHQIIHAIRRDASRRPRLPGRRPHPRQARGVRRRGCGDRHRRPDLAGRPCGSHPHPADRGPERYRSAKPLWPRETVLKDVRVIAVDQQTGARRLGRLPPVTEASQQSRTVTLEVSPEDVETGGRGHAAWPVVPGGASGGCRTTPSDLNVDHAVTYSQRRLDRDRANIHIGRKTAAAAPYAAPCYSGTSDKEYPF